jgi:sec-independent protein translocase protein TatB
MFNVGGGEIMVILLLALLVLGPDKLPEYTRKAGRYINEFRRMTSGFQEEFRQAMDVGDLLKPPSAAPAPAAAPSEASGEDALDRTTEGPRLVPQPEAQSPTAPPAEPAADTPAPPSPSPGAFAADVTPAPGTGPELITPSRPPVDHEGDAGSSSAA